MAAQGLVVQLFDWENSWGWIVVPKFGGFIDKSIFKINWETDTGL